MINEDAIRRRWEAVGCKCDERGRRLFAAGEVRTAGWGGLAVVSKITGLGDALTLRPSSSTMLQRDGAPHHAVASAVSLAAYFRVCTQIAS
jgi:hypothetical protein